MDKHTRRYFSDMFQHYHEGMGIQEAMNYMNQGAETSYMHSAIMDEFHGFEQDFLRRKLLEKEIKGGEW